MQTRDEGDCRGRSQPHRATPGQQGTVWIRSPRPWPRGCGSTDSSRGVTDVSITTSARRRQVVGVAHAGELGGSPRTARGGVEPLDVALPRRPRAGWRGGRGRSGRASRPGPGLLRERPRRGRSRRRRRCRRVEDLAGDPADPPDVEVAVLAGEGRLAGEGGADDVAVEDGDRVALGLELGHQRIGDGRLARAGEAGEEDGDAGVGSGAGQCLSGRGAHRAAGVPALSPARSSPKDSRRSRPTSSSTCAGSCPATTSASVTC